MAKIKEITAREILDSKGIPTIETTVVLSDGVTGKSAVPSGTSKGTYEAFELRDMDMSRFQGFGVLKAIENIRNIIAPNLIGIEAHEQQKADSIMIELDGTQNKSKLGANAILSVSQAILKAGSRDELLPLFLYVREFLSNKNIPKKIPTPLFNVLEGGKHAPNVNGPDIQEFLIIPASSKSFEEGLKIGVSVYLSLKRLLGEKNLSTLVADEGGFAPQVSSNGEAFSLVKSAIEAEKLTFSLDVFLGIDVAANSFHDGGGYKLKDRVGTYNQDELIDFYKAIFSEYSLLYLEDPFAEEDWDGWKKIYRELSSKTLIVGDDLTTTNPYRLQQALQNNAINGIVIKPNQIGTVTETIAVVEIARFKNLKTTVSHRSGETQDDFIADFAVGVGADYVKFGPPVRERVIKYNRLLEIQRELVEI